MLTMKKLTKIVAVAAFVAALTVAAGCRSARGAAEVSVDYARMTLDERFAALARESGLWDRVSVPVKVELLAPSSMSLSGKAYMKRGESVYVSLRFLGMEVANIYVTADSVFAADRVNKRYLAEDISGVFSGADFTVADIQDMMTGRVFVDGRGTLTASARRAARLAPGESAWTITPERLLAGIACVFTVDNATNQLRELSADVDGRHVTCDYGEAVATAAGVFASSATVTVPSKSNQLKARLKWTWRSAAWRFDDSVGWRRPSGYRQIKAKDLIKALSRM